MILLCNSKIWKNHPFENPIGHLDIIDPIPLLSNETIMKMKCLSQNEFGFRCTYCFFFFFRLEMNVVIYMVVRERKGTDRDYSLTTADTACIIIYAFHESFVIFYKLASFGIIISWRMFAHKYINTRARHVFGRLYSVSLTRQQYIP